jgi:uncharacterized membrane protein YhdT
MAEPTPQAEASKLWIYAFTILLLISIWMLTMRLMNSSFLPLDFELTLVYLPTVLAGVIVVRLVRKRQPDSATNLTTAASAPKDA